MSNFEMMKFLSGKMWGPASRYVLAALSDGEPRSVRALTEGIRRVAPDLLKPSNVLDQLRYVGFVRYGARGYLRMTELGLLVWQGNTGELAQVHRTIRTNDQSGERTG